MTVRWSMRPSTYDRMMRGSNQLRYFENSGYFNFGYWGAGAKSQREAEARSTAHYGAQTELSRGLGAARVAVLASGRLPRRRSASCLSAVHSVTSSTRH